MSLYLGGVGIRNQPSLSGILVQKHYDNGLMQVQNATQITLVPLFTLSNLTVGQQVLVQCYFELYCNVSGFQTFVLNVDGTPGPQFVASFGLPSFRRGFTYVFSFTATASSHTLELVGQDSNGLQTDTHDSWQVSVCTVHV